MTYAEKMAIEIHKNCIHESMKAGNEVIKVTENIINQIIADTKRACKEAYMQHYGAMDTQSACMDSIDQAEIKEQSIDAVNNAVKAHMQDMEE